MKLIISIRGILEILLGIYLITNWHNVPTWLMWYVGIAIVLEGINSILKVINKVFTEKTNRNIQEIHKILKHKQQDV